MFQKVNVSGAFRPPNQFLKVLNLCQCEGSPEPSSARFPMSRSTVGNGPIALLCQAIGVYRVVPPKDALLHSFFDLRPWEPASREAKPGVSKPGCFPLFLGKVQIVSRTLSGLFLVGALNRPRKKKRTNRENPRTIPEQMRKIPEKSGKSQKGQKRTKKDKKEGRVQIGKPPRLKPPRSAALDSS